MPAGCGDAWRLERRRRALRHHEHERTIAQPFQQEAQQLQGGGIGPVQVLGDHDHGVLLQAALELRMDGEEDLLLELLRVEVAGVRLLGLQAEHVAKAGREGRHLAVADAQADERRGDLLVRHDVRVARVQAPGVAQQRGRHAVGALAER